MCVIWAYVKHQDREDMVLDAVNLIRTEGGEVILRNLFGEGKAGRGSPKCRWSKTAWLVEQA